MLMRNAITASKNANCVDFTGCNNIIPLFHTKKQKTDTNKDSEEVTISEQRKKEMDRMFQRLNKEHSEFISNVLFYIAGYIVSKLIENLSCSKCKRALIPLPTETTSDD